MTTEQSNYYDMFLAVEKFYADNQTVLDSVLARKTAFGKLKLTNPKIGEALGKQSIPGTGVTLDKQAARDQVDQITYTNISTVFAYAQTIGNNTLAEQMNYAHSSIAFINDETIADWAEERKDIINGILASLADYGLDATTQQAWQDAIDAYRPLIPSTRNYVVENSAHGATLDSLIIQNRDLLNNVIDRLMNVFRFSDSIFYGKYKTARNIINLGHGHSSENPPTPKSKVGGKVTDSTTGEPIIAADVKLITAESELTTTTNSDGQYTLTINTPAAETAADVVASKDGYTPTTSPVNISTAANGSFTVNLQLDPSAPPPPPPLP